MQRVAAEPIITSVRMSARSGSACANVVISMRSSGWLTARGKHHGSIPAAGSPASGRTRRQAARAVHATAGCTARSRSRLDAAAISRRCTTGQGFRLSDSEMAQKSCPSGAPIRAAAANIAEMPGTTSISSARQAGSAALDRLEHRARHARTRRDRRPTPRRRAAPRRPTTARARARSRSSAVVRRRGVAGRRLGATRRDTGHSRPGRSRRASAAAAPAASAARRRPGRGRQWRDARSSCALPAGHQHHREIRRRLTVHLGQRHDAFAAHRAALDINRTPGDPGRPGQGRLDLFGRLRPTFMITAASQPLRRVDQRVFVERAGQHASARRRHGRAACAPGSSTAHAGHAGDDLAPVRAASRSSRYMDEP